MAKMTNLQLVNAILKNIGEPTISALTSMTTIQTQAYDALNDVIYDLSMDAMWRPLETIGTFTMTTGTNTYTEASDLMHEDIFSFRTPDNTTSIACLNPQDWDSAYPAGIGTATTGYPTAILRYEGKFHLNKYPSATQNGKVIWYRYWKTPTTLSTTTTGSTTNCWFPEGTDSSVLVNLATFKVLTYKNAPEAQSYYQKVYGQGGSMGRMMKRFANDAGKLQVRVTEPM